MDFKDVFLEAIQQRLFINKLTNDEIDFCYKCFKTYRKNRNKSAFFGLIEYFMTR